MIRQGGDAGAGRSPRGEAMVLDELDNFIVRLADEGVPIGAIARVTKLPPGEFRPVLRDALAEGRIVEMPREDWPPLARRVERMPGISVDAGRRAQARHRIDDDDTVLLALNSVFKTTRLQSKVLLRLLRRGLCPMKMLHDTIEENRGNPAEPTQDKIVAVTICHLRKKLTPFDISIITHHSSGYSIPEKDRQRVVTLLEGSAKCPGGPLNIGLDTLP